MLDFGAGLDAFPLFGTAAVTAGRRPTTRARLPHRPRRRRGHPLSVVAGQLRRELEEDQELRVRRRGRDARRTPARWQAADVEHRRVGAEPEPGPNGANVPDERGCGWARVANDRWIRSRGSWRGGHGHGRWSRTTDPGPSDHDNRGHSDAGLPILDPEPGRPAVTLLWAFRRRDLESCLVRHARRYGAELESPARAASSRGWRVSVRSRVSRGRAPRFLRRGPRRGPRPGTPWMEPRMACTPRSKAEFGKAPLDRRGWRSRGPRRTGRRRTPRVPNGRGRSATRSSPTTPTRRSEQDQPNQ